MRQKSVPTKEPAEQIIKGIRRATRRHFSAEDKIRIVLEGLRGEASIAELCRREGSSRTSIIAGRRIFSRRGRGDWLAIRPGPRPRTKKELRRETGALKDVVAELTLENRLLKKSVTTDGEDAA